MTYYTPSRNQELNETLLAESVNTVLPGFASKSSADAIRIDYKTVLDTITEGIYAVDRAGMCIYCNTSALSILGFNSPDCLIGKNLHELVHYARPDGSEYPIDECKITRACNEGKNFFAADEVFWRADGTPVPISYHSYPLYQDGELAGAVVAFNDISAVKEQQRKLEIIETKYRNFFRTSNAGLFYVDEQGFVLSVNQAFQDLVQYTLAELQQFHYKEIINPDDWQKILKNREDIKAGRTERFEMENRYIRKDGQTIWTIINVTSFRESPDSTLYFAGVVTDITHKKEFEQKLIESKAAKDKFFSIIAHDLRNPIGSMKLLGEFIKDELQNNNVSEASNLFDLMSAQVDQTYELLNDLLDWSRAQSQQIPFIPVILNVSSIFEQQIQMSQLLSQNKRITLQYIADPSLQVKADANMLNTILRNLLTNAIKFSFEKSQITLRAEERAEDILISVEDQGKGIEPLVLAKLFRDDAKYTSPGTHNESGTGLGLLLCKEFVELHNGKIWVESEPGRGSTFKFSLPKRQN